MFFYFVFYRFLSDFGVHFGAVLASKIDLGGAPAAKRRLSILTTFIMKIKLFDLGRHPGATKIDFKIAFRIRCVFL